MQPLLMRTSSFCIETDPRPESLHLQWNLYEFVCLEVRAIRQLADKMGLDMKPSCPLPRVFQSEQG